MPDERGSARLVGRRRRRALGSRSPSRPAGDLLCALEDAVGYDSHVLLIDASFLSTPDYDLNGFVQNAMGRGKDCVAYLDVDQSEAGVRAQLALERNPAGRVVANPEVVSVVPYPDGLKGEGGSKPSGTRTVAVCGPVWFLRASTLPLVAEFFADEGLRWSQSGVAPDEMLGRMLAFLQARETFYALEMKHCFPIAAAAATAAASLAPRSGVSQVKSRVTRLPRLPGSLTCTTRERSTMAIHACVPSSCMT